jgi:hypothetical protein
MKDTPVIDPADARKGKQSDAPHAPGRNGNGGGGGAAGTPPPPRSWTPR